LPSELNLIIVVSNGADQKSRSDGQPDDDALSAVARGESIWNALE